MSPIEFALARIEDDDAHARDWWTAGLEDPAHVQAATAMYEKSLHKAALAVNIQLRKVGVLLLAKVPRLGPWWLRGYVEQWSEHPDFDPAWRVA